MQNTHIKKPLFILLALICLVPNTDMKPLISPVFALFLGILTCNIIGNPFERLSCSIVKNLLKISVIGLGFGIQAEMALEVGSKGFVLSFVSIVAVMILGYFIGRRMKIDKKTGYLISAGTAICGGSAISAVSPIVKADDSQISISLGVIFILNAVALFVFPIVGHLLDMSQQDFGTWAAIAIHDTSSVVGAGAAYGDEAASIATTLKLTRTLWIIPISFFTLWAFKSKGVKIHPPYFILLFVLAIGINSSLPEFDSLYRFIDIVSHQILILTLYLIGASLYWSKLKNVGRDAILLGVTLWVFVSVVSLLAILHLAS